MKPIPMISVDLDAKCKRCGKKGATQSGVCLVCIRKGVERGEFDHLIKKARQNLGLEGKP